MTSLRDIRGHLRSVENIKKITDAMERVAAAQLHRVQAKAEQTRPYISKMKEILEKFASLDDYDAKDPLLVQREVKKTGLVVISSDRGLAGSYNANILSAADKFLKKYTQDQVELILLGRKAIEHYHRRKWQIAHQQTGWGENLTFQEVKTLTDLLLNWFLTGKYDEIWVIYTHYASVMRREVKVEKFLNIGKPQTTKTKESANYIFEPNPQEILAAILPRYLLTHIQAALYESYASELAARVIAMQTASKNSEEMITQLTLKKNKMRQRDITREMIEIATGAESLK